MRARNRPDRHGPPSAPLPTSRPTEERQRQAEAIEAPVMSGSCRPWWAINTRLDRLYADELIGLAAHQAACRLRDDVFLAGAIKASSWNRLDVSGVGDAHGDMLSRIAAVRRLRAVRTRLGGRAYALLYWVAVDDLPWTQVARGLGVCDSTAKRAAAEVINALAERG